MTDDDAFTDLSAVGEQRRGVTALDGTTKARIERAALELFAARGVDGVSVKELAEAARISVGALYRHFDSKEALALSLFDAIHARLHDGVKAALEAAENFDEAVVGVVESYCRAADDDPALFGYHLTHMVRFTTREDVRTQRPDPVGLIAARLDQAVEQWDLKPGDNELRAAAALGVVLQPAIHRMAGRLNTPLTDHVDDLSRAAFAVLLAI